MISPRAWARISFGIAAVAAGAALILVPLGVHAVSIVAGLGIAVVGIAVAWAPGAPERPTAASRTIGALIALLGLILALWPMLGAAWLARLVSLAVLAYGVDLLIRALSGARGAARTDQRVTDQRVTDQRVTAVIAAVASVVIAFVTFSWPVLTLAVFRLALGAWLVFIGLKTVLEPVRDRARRRAEDRARAESAADLEPPAAASPAHPPSRVRRWSRTLAASLALIVALALAYGSVTILSPAPLPRPGAFYTPPAEVPSEPGRLIRSEPLDVGVPPGAQAWKILYTTTDQSGAPAVSSGTILAPQERDDDPLPLLTVSHGTTGVVGQCAPSMSAAPFADGAGTAMQEMVTKHGWVAVTSDYVGLGTPGTHAYLVGEAEARNVLDATRAAQQFDEIVTGTDTVVWGHSQGGQGSLWTGQFAAEYAPELTLHGIAAFAPAADLYGLADADKNDVAGKVVSAYIAETWDVLYPELELDQHLTPGSAGPAKRISELCFNGQDVLTAALRGSQVPNQIFPDALLAGPFGDRLKAQEPKGPFPAPVLVAQGLADDLVKPELQDHWVEARCKAGEEIDYRTYPGLGHVSLVAADSPLTPQIVQWTLDRWDGKPATPNCGSTPEQEVATGSGS